MIDKKRNRRRLKMSKDKDYVSGDGLKVTTHMDNFDLETFSTVFVKWVEGFKKSVFDVEFNGDKVIGDVDVTDNKISFRTTIKWGLEIERIDGHPSPDVKEILKVVDPDAVEDNSDELKKEKEHNLKYGVEMKETFPFPDFDSGVPQEVEEDTKETNE
jgi:hypothetical protein